MQRIILKKASIENTKEITALLLTSNYKYEDKLINNFSSESISEFVRENINFFTIYIADGQIQGFSLSHTYKDSLNKEKYFKTTNILSKFKELFIKKEVTVLEKDAYYVDYIYFNKSILNKTSILLKYLEIEKLQNKCSKIISLTK